MVMTRVSNDAQTLHVSYYETHRKKQGIVELTLVHPEDSEKIHDGDTIEVPALAECVPGNTVQVIVHHPGAQDEVIEANCA